MVGPAAILLRVTALDRPRVVINALAFMAIPAGIAWALLLPNQFAKVIAAGGGPWIFVLVAVAYLFGFIPGTEGWELR